MKVLYFLPITFLLFASCKKEEYNCGQAQADYYLMCQERIELNKEIGILKGRLQSGWNQAISDKITKLGSEVKGKENDMRMKNTEMRDNGCSTNIDDDCLK